MKRFTILGGDQRSIMLAKLLIEEDVDVQIFGFDYLDEKLAPYKTNNLELAISDSNIIICPLPFTEDNVHLNTPLYTGEISIEKVFELASDKQVLFGGNIPKSSCDLAQDLGVHLIDYFKREELQILNAIPTAEGAIQIALEKMKITLFDSHAIVLGFGRIGKTIAKTLKALGANTYVAARKQSDLAWIKSYGYNPILFSAINEVLPKMDVIFNTVPYIVLKEEELESIKNGSIIIDVASKPGGIDLKKADELQVETITALGLPGKVAPITAARFIKDTIYNVIEEMGVF